MVNSSGEIRGSNALVGSGKIHSNVVLASDGTQHVSQQLVFEPVR